MAIQIEPGEDFPISRLLANHLITDTFFVRATIRDAKNNNTLETVDLTDQGGRYFSKTWKVVHDNALSKGRYITIETSVFTDSGFTTKSEDYGDELETYLIHGRWDLTKFGAVGASGDGINLDDIELAMKKMLDKEEKPKKQKDLDMKLLVKLVTDSVIASLPPFPKQEKVDFSGVEGSIQKLKTVLDSHVDNISNNIKTLDSSVSTSVEDRAKPLLREFTKELNQFIKTAKSQADFSTEKSEKTLEQVVDLLKDFKEKLPALFEDVMDSKTLGLSLNLTPNVEKKKSNVNKLKNKFGIK